MLGFTLTVQEARYRDRYRYGMVKVVSSDLSHLVGQKVHVLVLQEEEYRQLMDTLQGESNKDLCSELEELEEMLEDLFSPGSVLSIALDMYEEKRRQELALRTIYRKRGRRGKTAATEEVDMDKIEIAEMQDVKTRIQELKRKLEDLSRRLRC